MIPFGRAVALLPDVRPISPDALAADLPHHQRTILGATDARPLTLDVTGLPEQTSLRHRHRHQSQPDAGWKLCAMTSNSSRLSVH